MLASPGDLRPSPVGAISVPIRHDPAHLHHLCRPHVLVCMQARGDEWVLAFAYVDLYCFPVNGMVRPVCHRGARH